MLTEGSDLWASALATLNVEDRQRIAFEGQDKLDVLTDLQTQSNAAKDKALENRWRFRRPGRGGKDETVVLRDLFSKIVVWVDRFKQVGDIAVQYDPAHAALPWAGVRFLLILATSDIKKFAFVVEGAEIIARSISRYAIFEDLYLHRVQTATKPINSLEKALIRLYGLVFQYLAKAKEYFGQSATRRALKALVIPQEEFEEIMRRITSEESIVDRYASLVDVESQSVNSKGWITLTQHCPERKDISDNLQALSIDQGDRHAELRKLLELVDGPICRMSNQLENIEDHLSDSKRESILRWLSDRPYESHHKQIRKQAFEGSGQWLLQDPLYAEWQKASVSSLLFLHGKPGSGKSTLISLVIDDATKRFEAGQSPRPVYFYCSRSAAELERTNPDTVIASILRQLSCAQIDNPLPSSLVDKYKKQGQGFESHGLPLEESLQLIIAMIGDYGMITIVVDALDERDPNTRQSLLDAFEDILRESAGLVKIFVSSRDDQDIVYTLRGYPNLDISSDKNAADIEVFVEKETQRLVQRGRLLRNSRAKVDMFRWASLQLEVLCTLKLDQDIRGRLGILPPKLEQLYLEVYNELSSHEGDAGRSIIDNTLKWLLCAQRMLHTSEFLMAVAVNLDIAFEGITIDHILDLCHNFVLYDEELDVFRFAHLSVREFLEKRPAFDQIPCNLLAAESCLLQIIGSSNSTDLVLDQSIERVTRLRARLAPSSESASKIFLAYANVEWMNHCKLIPQSVRTDHNSLARLLQSFLYEDSGHRSAFYVWIGWYCSRVWVGVDSEVSWQLQILLSNYSRAPARSFFVAIAYGFGEHVALCVLDRALGNEEKGKGLLLAVMANQHKIVDLLVKDQGDWKVTEPILFFAAQNLENERFAWLLDKATNVRLTARTVTAAGKGRNGKSMALLLQRYPGLVITEEMLKTSVISANHEAFRLLLARALDQVLTEPLFRIAIYEDQPIKLVSLLNRIGPCRLSPFLFRQAGIFSDGSLEVMLERGGAACITTEFMIGVALSDNLKALQLMVNSGGAISQELLVAVAGEVAPDVLRLLLQHGCVVNGDILKSQAKGRNEDYKSLEIMLNYVDDAVIAEELTSLMVAVAGSSTRGAIMRVLHDRAQDTKVSEDVLLAAACNFAGGSKMMEMFLEQDKTLTITAEVLICAMATFNLDVIVLLLERVEEVKSIMNELLEAAAQNLFSGGKLMRLLLQLKSANITRIPDVVFDKAIGNGLSGENVIRALEESFGPIEVTEDVMLKLVRKSSGCGQLPSGANYLFDPALITGTVFLAAMSIDPPRLIWEYGGTRLDIRHVVENALHLPVTPDILKAAARYSDVACFRTLWIRGGMATDTRELMQRAAKNSRDGHPIFQFLLDQVEIVEINETLMLAIVGNPDTSMKLLRLLWERDITLSVTHDVLQTAIANTDFFQDIDCWGLTFLLEHFSHVEVTDDLFKTTATAGNEDLLCKLSQLCNMESPPGKWLDVARLYKAVALGDNDSLNNLLERGVELEARELECTFPVKRAFERDQVSTIQILLAAGMAPDALIGGRTLLFSAAAWGKHKLVEVLAKAGASLDFKGAMYENRFDDGYTPCAIAKKRGFYYVFKLLEQFEKDRDREREAATVIST